MNTDPIADMLTRIRNASRAGHSTVDMPSSKIKKAIADIMKVHGFIEKVETMKEGKFEIIRITLAPGYESLMLKRKSKPGLRKYLSKEQLRPIKHNYGIGVVSTSQGLMTTVEAKDKGLGGEYICEIY